MCMQVIPQAPRMEARTGSRISGVCQYIDVSGFRSQENLGPLFCFKADMCAASGSSESPVTGMFQQGQPLTQTPQGCTRLSADYSSQTQTVTSVCVRASPLQGRRLAAGCARRCSLVHWTGTRRLPRGTTRWHTHQSTAAGPEHVHAAASAGLL